MIVPESSYSQHYATIPPKLKTHADNTKHGFYCYNFIMTICVVPGAGLFRFKKRDSSAIF